MVQGNCNAVSLLAVAKVAFENSRFSSLVANGDVSVGGKSIKFISVSLADQLIDLVAMPLTK